VMGVILVGGGVRKIHRHYRRPHRAPSPD
jgi:hypothetical protein